MLAERKDTSPVIEGEVLPMIEAERAETAEEAIDRLF